MNFLNFILLDGSPTANGNQQGSPYSMWIMLGLLMVVFYFFMIRPQSKKQKELRKFRDSLAEGTKVVTVGGIYGKVAQIKDDIILLEIAENVRIKIEKGSVVQDSASAQEAQAIKK